jgi:hypothetical protein
MITVRILYLNGTDDIKQCRDIDELCLDGVKSIIIIHEDLET